MDIVSDAIDWVSGLTWNAAGVAASLLVGVVVVSGVLSDRWNAWRRTRRRDALIHYLDEGDGLLWLIEHLDDREDDISMAKIINWAYETERYIGKQIGPGAEASFRSARPWVTEAVDVLHSYTAIEVRLNLLRDFLTELRR